MFKVEKVKQRFNLIKHFRNNYVRNVADIHVLQNNVFNLGQLLVFNN